MEFFEILVVPIYQKTESEKVELRVSRDSLMRYYVRIGKSFYDTLDEVWRPCKEGATIPLTIESAQNLIAALCSILSVAESRGLIDAGLKDTIKFVQ
jgi:hypothetical protein